MLNCGLRVEYSTSVSVNLDFHNNLADKLSVGERERERKRGGNDARIENIEPGTMPLELCLLKISLAEKVLTQLLYNSSQNCTCDPNHQTAAGAAATTTVTTTASFSSFDRSDTAFYRQPSC